MWINNTTNFIFPLLVKEGYNCNDFKNDSDIIECYIADYYLPEFDDTLIVVSTNGINKEMFIVEPLKIIKKENHILQIFDIPDRFINDYFSIVAGNLSEVSEKAKNKIISFWKECKNKLETIEKSFLKGDISVDIIKEIYLNKEDDVD